MAPPNRKVHGIRGPIPSGMILGRTAKGDGDVQLLSLRDLQGLGVQVNNTGGGGGGGGGGGITALTGDVTAAGSGSVAATISNSAVTTPKIANDAVTYAKMQNISASLRIIGRKTALAGDPEEITVSELLDFVGSAAQGDVLYRGAATWNRLPAGTSGQFLKTLGTGADPAWDTVTAGITQLTGDATAGPGSGSQALTLASTGVTPGTYTNATVTVDAKGRVTGASSGGGVAGAYVPVSDGVEPPTAISDGAGQFILTPYSPP